MSHAHPIENTKQRTYFKVNEVSVITYLYVLQQKVYWHETSTQNTALTCKAIRFLLLYLHKQEFGGYRH